MRSTDIGNIRPIILLSSPFMNFFLVIHLVQRNKSNTIINYSSTDIGDDKISTCKQNASATRLLIHRMIDKIPRLNNG
jgi:hypothetical protein